MKGTSLAIPCLAALAVFSLASCATNQRLPGPSVYPAVDTTTPVTQRPPQPAVTQPLEEPIPTRRRDWPHPAPIEVKPVPPGHSTMERTGPDQPLWQR